MDEYGAKAMLDCARRLVEEGKPLHAAQLYHRLLAALPGLDEPYVSLARIYHEWHRDAEAEAVLKQGIRRSVDAERCATLLAERYLERGAYEEVLVCLGPLRAKRRSAVHECSARALLHMGKLPEAEMEIRMALRVEHRASQAREVLGNILLRRHRPAEAIAELKQALRLDPTRGATHRLLGEALAQEHCWPEALEEFTQAVGMDPGDTCAWGLCGEALLRLRRHEEAEPYFRRALELDRAFSDAEVGLGEIALQRGETECALEAFDKALQLHPGHQRALDGKLRARVGVTRLAVQMLHVLLLVLLAALPLKAQDGGSPSEAEEMFRHGVALYDEGRFAEADTVFGKVLGRYPSGVQSSAATVMRAKALYWSGRNLESANAARGFLFTFPSSAYVADAHYLLGVIYRRIRRGEEAMRELLLAFLVLNALFWCSVLARLFRGSEWILWLFGVSLSLSLAAGVSAALKYRETFHSRAGVVLAEEVKVRAGFTRQDTVLYVLHEGTEFSILGEEKGYWKTALGDGKKGWIPADSAGRVILGSKNPAKLD